MKKHNFPLYKIFVYVALITLAISIIGTHRMGIPCIFKIAIGIGEWKSI